VNIYWVKTPDGQIFALQHDRYEDHPRPVDTARRLSVAGRIRALHRARYRAARR
jgi:hypothetical protein